MDARGARNAFEKRRRPIDAEIRLFVLFFALLNPFLMSIYLLDLIEELSIGTFVRVVARASLVSGFVFVGFAWGGDELFTGLLQARFESFQIFGGLVFGTLGFQFMFRGPQAIRQLRGSPEHLVGSIALPFIIGPGTVSASVVVGEQLPLGRSTLVIACALALSALCLFGIKTVLDGVRKRNVRLVERYVDIVGRASALLVGTLAVEMICRGIEGIVGAD